MQKSVKEDRERYVGGSDIPIIMGISPFKTRYELLLEKAGLKEDDFEGNEYTEYGNILEPKIRDYINKEDEKNGIGGGFAEYKKINGDIRCHLDGYNGHEVLEIKTTSQIYSELNDYKTYLVQLLFYMEQVKCKYGLLAVYHRPNDFDEEFDSSRLNLFTIEIEDYKDLLEKINQAVDQFRIDLQKLKENPFLTEEDLLPVDLTKIANDIIALENKLQEYKKIEEEQKELKDKLKQMMEEKSIKKWKTPNGVKITLVEDGIDKEVLKFNESKFKEENEDIYNKYLETKIQKGKSGYVKITFEKQDNAKL